MQCSVFAGQTYQKPVPEKWSHFMAPFSAQCHGTKFLFILLD